MKILIVNYRYFVSGGPERYMFNIIKKLKEKGHEVSVFSVHSNRNEKSAYSKFFVEPIGGRDVTYYNEYKKTPKTIAKMIARSCYSIEVKKAIQKEIKEVQPNIVYIIHFVNKLSPSVITGAKELGVPVVLRLSDFFLLCPKFDFLYKESVCEDCLSCGYAACIKKKCVKDSLAASAIRVFSMKLHRFMRVYEGVDAFITPTAFMKNKLAQNGFLPEKIHHIPTFTACNADRQTQNIGSYGIYFGRISPEKGVDTVVQAYSILRDRQLKIVGDDTSKEAIRLKQFVRDNHLDNIEFTGAKYGAELDSLISKARFCIIPSIWYENLPNTILESFQYSKPVIASRIGSLPEVITDGYNGLLFTPKDHADLCEKIKLLNDDELVRRLGENGAYSLKSQYAADTHYQELMSVFHEVLFKYAGANTSKD